MISFVSFFFFKKKVHWESMISVQQYLFLDRLKKKNLKNATSL